MILIEDFLRSNFFKKVKESSVLLHFKDTKSIRLRDSNVYDVGEF